MDQQPQPTDGWIAHPILWAAGLAGAMVSLAHTKGLSLGQRLMTIVVGVLTAAFLTPWLALKAALDVNGVAATGFLIGLTAMLLTAMVVALAERAKNDPGVLIDLLRRAAGKSPAPAAPLPPPAAPPQTAPLQAPPAVVTIAPPAAAPPGPTAGGNP